VKGLIVAICAIALGTAPAVAQPDTGRAARPQASAVNGQEGWLGMGLSCTRCSYRRSGRAGARWTFSEPPTVFSVDANGPADRAGLKTGDTLVSIDGMVLVSREGGEAFGSIRPGQQLTIHLRRDGRESDARLLAGTRPYRISEFATAENLRELARERAVQAELQAVQNRRWTEQAQRALERQREYMERVMVQMQRAESEVSDSTRSAAVQRSLRMLDSATARWRVAESLYAQTSPAVAAVAPVAPVAAVPPTAAIAPVAPPRTYAEHREFGPLRYSGRLGEVVVEARSPLAVTTTEVTDSEVVVTSRDLSVRIAIRPEAPPAKRATPARAARPPRE
jgi:hypothetical protein